MDTPRKKTMSREQADALYHQLRKNMQDMISREKQKEGAKTAAPKPAPRVAPKAKPAPAARAAAKPAAKPQSTPEVSPVLPPRQRPALNRGHHTAIALVAACLCVRVALSAMEATGIATISPAQASIPAGQKGLFRAVGDEIKVSKEEVRLLTSLDARRAELEERNKRLDEREGDLKKRDSEFTVRMAEIRELTDKLKIDRERNDKKRENQLAQLANVYGSMNPQEAATLMEQLDSQIALALISRMPEKRIGQILALMSPDRALSITRMLSGGNAGR